MPKKPKQSALTKSAKGQECQIRIPGVCNFDSETTVPAHLPGGGMGMKHSDIHIAYACSACHDAVDGRNHDVYDQYAIDELKLMHLEGMVRTQILMLKAGLIKI